jgi:hypothetical protein
MTEPCISVPGMTELGNDRTREHEPGFPGLYLGSVHAYSRPHLHPPLKPIRTILARLEEELIQELEKSTGQNNFYFLDVLKKRLIKYV